MQFNPACLNQGGTPPPSSTTQQTNNPNTNHNHTHEQQQYLNNNLPTYTDAAAPNAWSNSIINALPLYGIFNSSLVAVPQQTEGSTFNIPVVSQQQVNDLKKKPSQKRPQGMKEDPLSPPKPDDKSQGLDDEQKMKRQRRLLKNREAAQQFRQRQKEYIQNLERKVADLNNVVQENHKHIELINTENRLLRDQLVYLYNVMRQNLSLSPTSPVPVPTTFSPLVHLQHLQQQQQAVPAPTAPPPGAADLGLAFKSFGMLEDTAFVEMLKNSAAPQVSHIHQVAPPLSVMIPSPVPLSNPPSLNPTPNHSPMPSPMPSPCNTPRISADLTAMSLSTGKEIDMESYSNNPMLPRYTAPVMKMGENEAQTVPELIIKAEGGGGM